MMAIDPQSLQARRKDRNEAAKEYDQLLDKRLAGELVEQWKMKAAREASHKAYEAYHRLAGTVASMG